MGEMRRSLVIGVGLLGLVLPASAGAAVTPTRDASALAQAMTEGGTGGVALAGASFVTITATGDPAAIVDSPLGGFPVGGSRFGLLTTGDAKLADDPNSGASSGANNGGVAVRGNTDRDVLILKLDVGIPSGANCLTVAFKFYSEEFPEFNTSSYNDAFIAELDESNWTTAGSEITAPKNFAFDPNGKVVSIKATGPAAMNAENANGTTYDGATGTLYASTTVTSGAHSLFLSIFDQGDQRYDSAVMIDRISTGTASAGACTSGAQSNPPPTTPTTPTTPSGPVGSTPPAFGPGGVIQGLPSPKKCVSKRNFRIRIRKRKGRTYEFATVFLNSKKVITRKGARITAPIDLRGLPKGRYTVKIIVITSTGETITGKRRYRTCTKRRKSGRPGPL